MRSGAKLRHDVSPERKGSKKTSFERKVLNSYILLQIVPFSAAANYEETLENIEQKNP